MAKASIVASKNAKELAAIKEQLDRIEKMLEKLQGQKSAKPAQEVKEKK